MFTFDTAHRIAREALVENSYQHSLRVAHLVRDPDAKIVALLHDVLEETALTLEDLRSHGCPDHIREAVGLVTREDDGRTYLEYITDIVRSGDKLALRVKRADLLDHLMLPPKSESLTRRYVTAFKILGVE